jgi:hypothetical protein
MKKITSLPTADGADLLINASVKTLYEPMWDGTIRPLRIERSENYLWVHNMFHFPLHGLNGTTGDARHAADWISRLYINKDAALVAAENLRKIHTPTEEDRYADLRAQGYVIDTHADVEIDGEYAECIIAHRDGLARFVDSATPVLYPDHHGGWSDFRTEPDLCPSGEEHSWYMLSHEEKKCRKCGIVEFVMDV